MIRAYHKSDLNQVISVWHNAIKDSNPSLSDELLDSQKEDIREKYLPVSDVWVYEKGGIIVGFVALKENIVGALFVEPSEQDQGIGTMLLRHVKAVNGSVSFEILKENIRVLDFYRKCGFTPTKEGLCALSGYPTVTMTL